MASGDDDSANAFRLGGSLVNAVPSAIVFENMFLFGMLLFENIQNSQREFWIRARLLLLSRRK